MISYHAPAPSPVTLTFEVPPPLVAWLLDDTCLRRLAWGEPFCLVLAHAFWCWDRYGLPEENQELQE